MGYDAPGYWGGLHTDHDSLVAVGVPELGRSYNHWTYVMRRSAVRLALRDVLRDKPASDWRVFEAAVGTGFYLAFWKSLGVPTIHGIDLAEPTIARLRDRFPDVALHAADLGDPALPAETLGETGSFDLTTAIDVLYHITDDDRWRTAVDNLCTRVAPGGRLLLTDIFVDDEPVSPVEHVRRRPLAWYEEALAKHGLRVERIQPMLTVMGETLPMRSRGRLLRATVGLSYRIAHKMLRLAKPIGLQPLMGHGIGLSQMPSEWLLQRLLGRYPGLEILVARRDTE